MSRTAEPGPSRPFRRGLSRTSAGPHIPARTCNRPAHTDGPHIRPAHKYYRPAHTAGPHAQPARTHSRPEESAGRDRPRRAVVRDTRARPPYRRRGRAYHAAAVRCVSKPLRPLQKGGIPLRRSRSLAFPTPLASLSLAAGRCRATSSASSSSPSPTPRGTSPSAAPSASTYRRARRCAVGRR